MQVKIGSVFDSDAQTLVNTVNTVGVMGKGIALQFKQRFPAMYAEYVERCERGEVKLGEPYLYRGVVGPWILNFPTKDHWRSVSRLSDIVRGLEYLRDHYEGWGILSLAVPPLGCGQGGLEWRVVGPTLFRYLSQLEIPVILYAPHGTPEVQLSEQFLVQPGVVAPGHPSQELSRIKASWVGLVDILERVVRDPHHWPVGRTTFQKLAYFATEAGIPTDFNYARGSYGPYSSDVKPLITKLVNNGILEEKRLGRMLALVPGPTYPDAKATFGTYLKEWDATIERVADLVQRLRTTNQAEVAATVHFAARSLADRLGAKVDEQDVLNDVLQWKQRRDPPLEKPKVALAIRSLGALGWLDVEPSAELPVPDAELLGIGVE